MKIHRINPLTKLPIIVDLKITKEEIEDYSAGKLIQNVWPNIHSDEREFFLSGIPMGLFEIQFETRFVEIFQIEKNQRLEVYFAKSLNGFFVYQYKNDELKYFFKVKYQILNNKISLIVDDKREITFNFGSYIEERLNKNEELLNFCKTLMLDLIYFEKFKPLFEKAFNHQLPNNKIIGDGNTSFSEWYNNYLKLMKNN
jgi:hypothetical protein